jgi:hypothetical protein
MQIHREGAKNTKEKRGRASRPFPATFLATAMWLAVAMMEVRAQEAVGPSGILKQVGGASAKAQLVGINEAGQLLFDGKSPSTLPADQVWRFGADGGTLRGPMMVLRDGSRYAAPALTTENGEFVFTPDDFHPGLWDGWRIALSDVRALLFKPQHGKAALTELLALSQPVAADALRLDNGDELQGEFRGIETDAASQTDEVHFAVRDRVSRIPISKAVSLRLAERDESSLSEPTDAWMLAFADGSRVLARQLVVEIKSVRWKSDKGQTRELNSKEFWKQVTLIEPPRRDIVYMSDLKEQSYRHLSTFGDAADWGSDRSMAGEPLRHQGAYYPKGISIWSNSRLSFAVPQSAKGFRAEICIDAAAGDRGSVVFRVLAQVSTAEGSELKNLYKSEVIRGGDASREVDVALAGATSLILLVEAADQGDALDLADWIDARFILEKAPAK